MRVNDFPFAEIEGKIGYVFKNKQLLKDAFTHSTYSNAFGGGNNERMEYLGDSVLQLVVTEWQYIHQGEKDEGELTRERQKYVCEDALDKVVRELSLEKYLLYSGGKANVGKKTVSSLFESVVAAIYLDGGYLPAKAFILEFGKFQREILPVNYKGMVQELLQKKGLEPPVYQTQKQGKDNAPIFNSTVEALGEVAHGQGGSKKQAEQDAAQKLYQRLSKHK